uniref:MTA2p n=1 Tax=Tetrahymena thermophila TaxID=5911 RepID=M1KK71_TETTH|nr:MTA2p [Tetrahymena thermophila]AGF25219.1 MTA2p [Tetrahymena thermophila]
MIVTIVICSDIHFIRNGIMFQYTNQNAKSFEIITNDMSPLSSATTQPDQYKQNVYVVNSLKFPQQQNNKYFFLPFPPNTFNRLLSVKCLDQNENIIDQYFLQNIVTISSQIQQLINSEDNNKYLQLTLSSSNNAFRAIQSSTSGNFKVQFTVENTLKSYPQNFINLIIDGQNITCIQSSYQITFRNQVQYTQYFNYSEFPSQFQNFGFQFYGYFFLGFNLQFSVGYDFNVIQGWNQFYSIYVIQNQTNLAYVRPVQYGDFIANELAFNIQQSAFNFCNLQQIVLPQSISDQFQAIDPILLLQNTVNQNNFTSQEIIYVNNGTIMFKNQNLQIISQLNPIPFILKQFVDVVGFNQNLSLTFSCNQNQLITKNYSIIQNEFLNANLTQALVQLNNNGNTPNLTIQIQIPVVQVQNSSFYLKLPLGINFLAMDQSQVSVQGFSFSQLNWSQNIISFLQSNFTSTSILISVSKVELQKQSNGKQQITKIIAKCVFNSTFVFYVDENTNQTLQIIQPSPTPITQIQINSFKQTSDVSLDIPEDKTSMMSQLVISFSILKFQSTCSWIIIDLPQDFRIGFIQQSQFSLQDCFGNSYTYLQGSSINSQQTLSYTDNNSCIYISCQTLRQIAQNHNTDQCLNNALTIKNVKSPDYATQTDNLNLYIANSYSSTPQNNYQPTFFNSSLNFTDSSLPYYFNPEEVFSYQGINVKPFNLSALSFQISSNYYRDIFNFSMIFSYPIYLFPQHKVIVLLPFKVLINQNLTCFPANIQCSLSIISQDIYPTSVLIQFTNQILPSINSQNKTLDVLTNSTQQNWINFENNLPLQLSNSLLGISGVNYTFFIQSLYLPQNLNSNYYVKINLDQNIQFNSSEISFFQIIQTQDGKMTLSENQITNFYYASQAFFIPLINLNLSKAFQLRISGLRNPSGNVAQTYNFQLIWSTQQGNSFKNVWVIQSVSLPITSKYTCSPNCQACASNYAACTACAPGYLKSQYNHHAVLACLPTCSPQYVAYNGTCLACQLKDPQCLSCSPSNLTQCSSCNQGYTLVPEFNGCVDSHLLQTARSRLLDYSLSTNLADNIDTTHPDDAQKSDKAQSLTRMTEESSSAKADQREGGESSSNTGSKVMGQLQDTVGALKGGGAIFIWIVLAALAVSVSQSVLRYTYNKLKGKSHSNGSSSGMRRSSSGSRSSSSGSSSAGRNASGKEHKGVREREKELRGQRIDCLMLFLLSVAEAIQMPYTLLWGFSVSGGDFESPVLQTLLGACALSTLLWIFDAYLLGSILANSENTPKTSCLLNPLPSSKREGCLSFLIVPARLAFCLIPKSVSLTLTNIFSVEGWFRYPYGEDVERATIVLTNFRKVLSSQIKSNVSGLCSLVSFLILQYPEVLSSYVQIYDLIIFDIVMTILCLTNIRNVDKLISTLNQIQESEGEL